MRRVVADKRRVHPELSRAVTLDGALAVCAREGIMVLREQPYSYRGVTFVFMGDVGIIIDSHLSDADQLPILLHELGHAWLHVTNDALMQARGTEIRRSRWGPLAERCEREADLVASLLLGRVFDSRTPPPMIAT